MKLKKNIAISDSGFIFNPSTGDSFSVNPIGQQILKYMKDGKEDAEIQDLILQEYRTDRSTLEKDMYDFNKMLTNYKLIQQQDA